MAPAPSQNGTAVSSNGQIIDGALNHWTIHSGVVYEGTTPAGYSANVTMLVYYGGTIYQQNKAGGWWYWNGTTWVGTSNPDPGLATPSGTGSTASGSSSSSGGSGSSTAASGTAAALLDYIKGLSGQSRHILSGQHTSYWDSDPMDYVNSAASSTGKDVAILGVTSGIQGSTEDAAKLANAWLAKGGIPMVSWWPGGNPNGTTSVPFSQITQPGTSGYKTWYQLLDQQIAILKQIKGPVLYRPFVELDGNWFWWGNQPTSQFVLVWKQMHDYFVSQGVTNILWVWNVNAWSGNYSQYYPGGDYVDIVSWDAYPPDPADHAYSAIESFGKPVMLAETGVETANNSAVAPFSSDNDKLLGTVKANFPKVFAVVIWCQNYGLPKQNGAGAFMNDSSLLALNDLPSGLVDP